MTIFKAVRRNLEKEHSWKNSGLQVYFVDKDFLLLYNRMVKDPRTWYFSELISAHQHDPRFLRQTVDQLVNPASSLVPLADCGADYHTVLERWSYLDLVLPPSLRF